MNQKEHNTFSKLDPRIEAIGRSVVDAAFKVHKTLGPGLLESAYEHCLAWELQSRGHSLRRQAALPIVYEATTLDAGYRLDLLVEEAIVVEIKSVDALAPIHEAQRLTYLKLSGLRLGYLMNFNSVLFESGLKRMIL